MNLGAASSVAATPAQKRAGPKRPAPKLVEEGTEGEPSAPEQKAPENRSRRWLNRSTFDQIEYWTEGLAPP